MKLEINKFVSGTYKFPLAGLGKTVYDDPSQPWLGSHEEPDVVTAAPTQSFLDKILGIGTKVTDFANKGVATYNNITKALTPAEQAQAQAAAIAGGYVYNPNLPNNGAPSTGMSTAVKVGIGALGLALATTIAIVATRKKSKGVGSVKGSAKKKK